MFDFGFWEVVIVAVVALIVVGPERLPGLARQIGTWVGKTRRFVSSVRSDIEREFQAEELKQILNKQQGEIQELKGMLSQTESELHRGLEDTDHLVTAIEEQLEQRPGARPESLEQRPEARPEPLEQRPEARPEPLEQRPEARPEPLEQAAGAQTEQRRQGKKKKGNKLKAGGSAHK